MKYDHGTQVGGNHYNEGDKPQHWDLVLMYGWDYFQGQVIKYLMRWKTKYEQPEKRLEDLKKARNFLDKYIAHEEGLLVREKQMHAAAHAARYPGDTLRNNAVLGKVVGEWKAQAERMLGIPGYDQLPVTYTGSAVDSKVPFPNTLVVGIESNEWWTNEGYYGDSTQLYKCRQCKSVVPTSVTPPPHGCTPGQQQTAALEANMQRVEAGAAVGGLAAMARNAQAPVDPTPLEPSEAEWGAHTPL